MRSWSHISEKHLIKTGDHCRARRVARVCADSLVRSMTGYITVAYDLRSDLATNPEAVPSFLANTWLPNFDDGGQNMKMRWGAHSSSRRFRWMHECRAHTSCNRTLLTTVVNGALHIRAKGQHSGEERLLKRKNDSLTWYVTLFHTS